ncbi:uroporphyrinogen-III synthase [Polaromonas sp. CT11-55]|uniref:uroporphyrinogen-III synthase n=1 Tax=Polaromonas sp. CT11-55 TaxID=3243045 RepID=UPI0039A4C57D
MPPMPAPAAGAAPVIVTRPAADAQHWVRELRQAGFAAEALPLIDIAAALDTGALAQAWQTLDRYAACMFVSGNAVAYFFKSPLAGGLPPSLRLMAPGPGTVAALLAAGVPGAQVDAPGVDAEQFDSEALWAVAGRRDWRGKRVLVVRGESPDAAGSAVSSGRDWIARQWEAAGAQVDFVGVYQRRAPQLSEAQLARARAASADGSVWLFSSSEALANLIREPALAGVDWRGARAVATHPRIVDAVRAAGWGVVVASRPALTDIRETLASIESLHP